MAIVGSNLAKDSRWLQLEVCREFTRNKCSRPDTECKFAHPPATVEVNGGRVIACYDSIKVSSNYSSTSFLCVHSFSTFSSHRILFCRILFGRILFGRTLRFKHSFPLLSLLSNYFFPSFFPHKLLPDLFFLLSFKFISLLIIYSLNLIAVTAIK